MCAYVSTFVALLCLAATPAVLAAPPAAEAEALIREGVALRGRGQDREALERFQRAQALAPSGRALAQIALAEQALGRWVEAERDLALALRAEQDPFIRMHQAALAAALADIRDQHLGSLEVLDAVPGARVTVNGQPAGTIPLPGPLRVPAGTVALEVSAPGYLPLVRTVLVPAGGLARESITLAAAPAAGRAIETAPAAAPTPERSWRRPAAIAALAGAGVGLGVGLAFQISRYGKVSDYNETPGCGTGLTNDGAPGCAELASSAGTAQTLAFVGYAGAAILGGLGAYLLLSSPAGADRSAETHAAAACAPTAGAWGLACAMRF